jgi:exonuclease SbcD
MTHARVLLLGDTHLGFDQPTRPRVERRRRGPDFHACFERALEPARAGQVDLVVHGGDLLYRSRVPPTLVQQALAPLRAVADLGIPVVIVPGNHERSAIPYPLLAAHPDLHILDRPRTLTLTVGELTVALAGFPYERRGVRERFGELLAATGWRGTPADVRLLCLHQLVEGSRVGVQEHVFREGTDIIRCADLPATGFAAVLTGHIHRFQILTRDLAGRRLPLPVVYPGSTERTSFAEREEPKGYVILEVGAGPGPGGHVHRWRFHELPARPMVELEVDLRGLERAAATRQLRARLRELDPEAVVRVRLRLTDLDLHRHLSCARVRALAPPTMNLTLAGPPT